MTFNTQSMQQDYQKMLAAVACQVCGKRVLDGEDGTVAETTAH